MGSAFWGLGGWIGIEKGIGERLGARVGLGAGVGVGVVHRLVDGLEVLERGGAIRGCGKEAGR